ncbi:MAG: DUF3048 domain-containing protein [Actinobacteria bacterium]|nr:DUF3048 domain-containing protein [Actinomycetota bacterium]
MSFNRKWRVAVATAAAMILLTACGSSSVIDQGADENTDGITPTPQSTIVYNSISGREGVDGPVIAVKIDDTRKAHPQIGLEKADVVYIEQVEGGLTRLLSIFSSDIPESVGPVRSARISDMELLAQYGHVAFAYSGAQSKLRPVIRAANLEDLGAEHESARIYPRDPNRYSPVNMILKAQLLLEKITSENLPVATSKSMGWIFGDAQGDGRPILSAQVFWPANSYSMQWSRGENRWLLFHGDSADVAAGGTHLGPTTFLIQQVSITPSIYGDKFGGNTPFSQSVGTGTGFVLRDGLAFAAIWNRPTQEGGTTWTRSDGTPITFARGQVWVALTSTAAIFTIAEMAPGDEPTK